MSGHERRGPWKEDSNGNLIPRKSGQGIVINGNVDLEGTGADTVVTLDSTFDLIIEDDDGTDRFAIREGGPVEVVAGNFALSGGDITEVGGTTDASSGTIRLANDKKIAARNAADTADLDLIIAFTDDKVYVGDAGDDAGLVLRSGTQVQIGLDGSASAPAIAFDNDTDTGIFLEAAGSIGLAAAGSEILSLSGSTETNDGMTADPETATEDAFLSVSIGSNNYQIPLYSA